MAGRQTEMLSRSVLAKRGRARLSPVQGEARSCGRFVDIAVVCTRHFWSTDQMPHCTRGSLMLIPEGIRIFQLPTIRAELDWLLMDSIPPQVRYLRQFGEAIAMRNRRQVERVDGRDSSVDFRAGRWMDNEMVRCEFHDVRHVKRLRQLLELLSGRVGDTTHWACQDWANTMAAYASLATIKSAKPISSQVVSRARESDFPPAVASRFWFFTIRRSCLTGMKIPGRSES
jgi:hypothetical protein